jgi:CRP-like cAMP-binding protein
VRSREPNLYLTSQRSRAIRSYLFNLLASRTSANGQKGFIPPAEKSLNSNFSGLINENKYRIEDNYFFMIINFRLIFVSFIFSYMKELELSLQTNFGLKSLEDAQKIANLFENITLKKGEFFLHANKKADKLAYIQSGFLRIYLDNGEKEITQWISTKGYFTTDLAGFIFNQASRWNIQALEDTQCFIITKENYNKLYELLPEWPELERFFIVKCFTTMENRIYTHLSMTAEERYQFLFENQKELFNQVPLQYIASMLGMTPETFSRIRKKQLK